MSTIDRPHLINALNKGFQQKLCLVTAPAGFGKTTLLSQWRQQLLAEGNQVAWLTLDEADGDVNNLVCYLIFSLISAGMDLGRLQMLAEQGLSDTSPRACLALLLASIENSRSNTVLILDDYHRFNSSSVDQFVNELLANVSDNFHLIINSREKPDLDISRLRSQGQILEFGPEQLRFNSEELQLIMGPDMAAVQIESLLEKSEGWPVTIQLLRQAIANGSNREDLLANYSGTSSHLSEYLSQQILDKCDIEVQQFLLTTSILERVNNSLGQALSGVADGFDKLEKTSSIATLFVPLDEGKQWLRYHHLFSDFLREQLQLRYPEQVTRLHLRASGWFEQDNNLIEAVRHACLASDFDHAAELIEQAGGWELILYGGIGFLRRLLQYFSEEQLKQHPRLQVARAYLCQKEGEIRLSRDYLEQARANKIVSSIDFLDKRQIFERDHSIVEVLQGNYEDDFSISRKYLQRPKASELRRLSGEDSIFDGVLNCSLSLYLMADSKFSDSISHIQQATQQMRQAQSILGTNYCYLHLGTLAFYQGSLRQSEAYCREAQAMADENFGSDSGLKYLADILIYSLKDWRSELDEDLQGFEKVLQHIESYDGWFEIYIAAYELLLARAWQEKKEDLLRNLVSRVQNVVDERLNQRLQIFVDTCQLSLAILENNELHAERLLHQHRNLFEGASELSWRPMQYFGAMAVHWYLHKRDFHKAEQCLQFMEQRCREAGAQCFLVNCLVLKAELEFHRKQSNVAAQYLFEAASLAWPESIMRPFIRNEHAIALIAAANNYSQELPVDRLSLNFLQQCSDQARKLKKHSLQQQQLLSSREMEVLLQLQLGLSNKEIARALEMTEHTVKFHLKNVFSKLGVDKRTKAVIAAREQGILD
ncbi:LuxR C-terminal-related transcriptional regulator [Pseudoteredinibacter isoporae]|uniref:LuxR C-terminal-related transcriptional regulator n=1 Tax=Pseudoteredinibacter isoporae TaxID=570281 RepID=UPI003101B94C